VAHGNKTGSRASFLFFLESGFLCVLKLLWGMVAVAAVAHGFLGFYPLHLTVGRLFDV